MKKERLFQVIGMIEDDLIKEAEDYQVTAKKRLFINMAWKWLAAAAGILLIVGTRILQSTKNKNISNTSFYENDNGYPAASGNGDSLSTTAAGALYEAAQSEEKQNIANDSLETEKETILAYAETVCDEVTEEEGQTQTQKEIRKVLLYAEIINEIYQPYQGHVLYLNLEDGGNLKEEQIEDLLEILYFEYKITAVTGNIGDFSKRGAVDTKTEELSGVYLSFYITEEDENYFAFQINCWGGRNISQNYKNSRKESRWKIGKNITFGWRDCSAFYNGKEWSYKLK